MAKSREQMSKEEQAIYDQAVADMTKNDGNKGKENQDVSAQIKMLQEQNQKLSDQNKQLAEHNQKWDKWYKEQAQPHWDDFVKFVAEQGQDGPKKKSKESDNEDAEDSYTLSDKKIDELVSSRIKVLEDRLTAKEAEFLNLRKFDIQLFDYIRKHPEVTDKEINDLTQHMAKNAVGNINTAHRDLFGDRDKEKEFGNRLESEKKKWEEDYKKQAISNVENFSIPKSILKTNVEKQEKPAKRGEIRQNILKQVTEKHGPGVLANV